MPRKNTLVAIISCQFTCLNSIKKKLLALIVAAPALPKVVKIKIKPRSPPKAKENALFKLGTNN